MLLPSLTQRSPSFTQRSLFVCWGVSAEQLEGVPAWHAQACLPAVLW